MEMSNSASNSLDNSWVNFTISRGPIRGLDRNRVGLTLKVQARRDLEEFMSNLAEGRRIPVDAVGDSWYNCSPTNGPLEVYDTTLSDAAKRYTLNAVGSPLLIDAAEGRLQRLGGGSQEEQINLSFLRLAGISNPEGVSIGFAGAYSAEYIGKIRVALPAVVKRFLEDYIAPVTINLHIVSRN